MDSELIEALCNLEEQKALELVVKRLDSGDDPLEILDEARRALVMVGEKFEAGEYFIPELIFSGEILKGITQLVKPKLASQTRGDRITKVVLGTVEGDIHDIGKDIVAFMLDISGFEVVDLGVDVSPGEFVKKAEETGAPIVGLSGFLTSAFESMKRTVDAFAEAGLREKVKIMIGGGQVDAKICEYTGADRWGRDAMEAVAMAKAWMGSE